MSGYTTQEVAEVLGLTASQVRGFARAGLVTPSRGPQNQYRFSFQDVVLLRTARELRAYALTPRRIHRALHHLREQLPEGRPLSAVHIAAEGDAVVVRDRETVWEPETGQVTFDFAVEELASKVASFATRMTRERAVAEDLGADQWYDLGWDLEAVSVEDAKDAYRRALALDGGHTEAHLNLGRLLHEEGRVEAAETQYRQALQTAPDNALAAFNLGVALEDRGDERGARAAYEKAVELGPDLASAHFNLARLCERTGDSRGALRHLAAFRKIDDAASA